MPTLRFLLLAAASIPWTPPAASAQAATALDTDEYAALTFRPSAGAQRYLMLDGAGVGGLEGPPIALLLDYSFRALYVKTFCEQIPDTIDCARTGDRVAFVEHMFVTHLTGSWAFGDRLEVGLGLPIVYAEGDGLVYRTAGGGPGSVRGGSGFGLGDPRLQLGVRLLGGRGSGQALGIGAVGWATAPLGQATMENRHVGDGGPNVGVHGVGELDLSERGVPMRVALNLGAFYRPPAKLVGADVGSMMSYGVGLDWSATSVAGLVAEITGATSFGSSVDQMEGRAAGRLRLGPLELTAGGGLGLVLGPGVPAFRVLVGLRWAPAPEPDPDGDGIRGDADSCPDLPEDLDGFADEDGCPDPDNDGDRIPDAEDRCPDEAEDYDGFEDEDGCPDPDNDGDGIPDGYDSCPDTPEDLDGDRDHDGCPDLDTDGDGIDDRFDRCPEEPEDTDGVADEDGCPETDGDGDGIPDEDDVCPEVPGVECAEEPPPPPARGARR